MMPTASEIDDVPYGAYIEADGSEALFNRAYQPTHRRNVDGSNPHKTREFKGHVEQIWFYYDGDSPRILLNPRAPAAAKKLAWAAYDRASNALEAFLTGQPLTPFVIDKG